MALKMASLWLTKNGLPNSLGLSQSSFNKNEATVEHLLQLGILSSSEFCNRVSSRFACLLASPQPSPSCLPRQPMFKMFCLMVSTFQSVRFPCLITFTHSTSISSSQRGHKCPDTVKTPCGGRPEAPPPSGQCACPMENLQQPPLRVRLSLAGLHIPPPPPKTCGSCSPPVRGQEYSPQRAVVGRTRRKRTDTVNVAPGFH